MNWGKFAKISMLSMGAVSVIAIPTLWIQIESTPGPCSQDAKRRPAGSATNFEVQHVLTVQSGLIAMLESLGFRGSSPSRMQTCTALPADPPKPEEKTPLQDYFATQKCSDIFSDSYKDEASRFTRWPVCSSIVEFDLKRNKLDTSPLALAQRSFETVKGFDYCRNGSTRMLGASHFVPPSRKELHFDLISLDERRILDEKSEKMREAASDFCCKASEHACRDYFHNIRFEWCVPQTDPSKPDTCVGNPTYYYVNPDGIGHMVRSPIKYPDGRGLSENLAILAHEFGHACVDTRVRFLHLKVNGTCDPSKEDLAVFKSLFGTYEGNRETWDCVKDMAQMAHTTRFEPFEPCENGCPYSQISEAFPNFFAAQVLSPKRLATDLLPHLCGALRNSTHALPADQIACFIKTPSVREKMERALQCIQ